MLIGELVRALMEIREKCGDVAVLNVDVVAFSAATDGSEAYVEMSKAPSVVLEVAEDE